MLLPGESNGWRSLVGCSPWGRWESDTTERLHYHFSLSCIGEGNGNPLQCSCLENPRVGGAWWAAIYGVAQSRTRMKRLSSSSGSSMGWNILVSIYTEHSLAKASNPDLQKGRDKRSFKRSQFFLVTRLRKWCPNNKNSCQYCKTVAYE